MCGLAGFFGKGKRLDLEKMVQRLAKRGPDDQGQYINQSLGVYLGHRRLSIIDVKNGAQPMQSMDGRYTLVFNGAIYNSPELREELEQLGHHFRTHHSDTEVLLNSYIQWGPAMLKRLNGMWAFVLFDQHENRAFCSRDRFGQKPFYYFHRRGVFAFSSLLDSLLQHPDAPRSVNELAIQKYLAYSYVPEPATLINGVKKLPAGHSLTYNFTNDSIQIDKYWDFTLVHANQERKLDDWSDELRERLNRAVKRRLLSDVPVGILLSGGIDSSIVAYLAGKHAQDKPVCFTISFSESGFSELSSSRDMANTLGMNLHHKEMAVDDLINWGYRVLDDIDDPLGDSSLIPTFMLCRETAKKVKVALGGDGADELFAGYAPFLALHKALTYQKWIPDSLHKVIQFTVNCLPVSHAYMSLDFKLKKTLHGLSYPKRYWLPVWMSALDERDLEELFQQEVKLEDVFEDALRIWEECESDSLVDKTLLFYTKLYLSHSILHKIDRAGMMNSLEVRSPFLDHEVAEFAMNLPARYKLHGQMTKYLLRNTFKDLLPSSILKKKKHGFAMPVGAWMHQKRIKEEKRTLPCCNSSFVQKKWKQHLSRQKDNRLFLWNQLTLSHSQVIGPAK
ncbi:MAG: asparagine synthase (glutamine-hydrolyzing) [Acidobacteria bacterium]|nr:MAG: asparagine synthase (glutamine-hydrolyzing) [Acidobacteriota bacterium]